MNKLRQRLGRGLRALTVGATVMLVVGLTTVLGGGTAVALWSIDNASIAASAGADTLRALDKPAAADTTATQISLQSSEGMKSDTLSPQYSLERSLTSDFSNSEVIGTADTSKFTDNGHLAAVATNSTFTKIVMGTDAGCGITAGKVMCWGNNTSGQLGQGTLEGNSGTPLQVKSHADDAQSDLPADVAILDIAVGLRTFCATTSTQDVYCWGRNESGAATGNSTDMKPFPAKVAATPRGNVSSISVGNSTACALFEGFGAYCWGSNSVGQLGAGIAVSAGPFAPRKVLSAAAGSDIPAGTTLQMVRAGNDMGCVITSGVAYCWGSNLYRGLGIGTTVDANAPKAVVRGGSSAIPAGTTFTDISLSAQNAAVGQRASCAVAGGAVYCWGAYANGSFGNSAISADSAYPVRVSGLPAGTVTNLSSGFLGSCVVIAGRSHCWGSNAKGQFANGSLTGGNPIVTTVLPGGKTVKEIVGQSETRCWLFTDGSSGCAGLGGAVNRLGEGPGGRVTDNNTSIGTMATPVPVLCVGGTLPLADGTCSLKPATTYYYRMFYTLGNWKSPLSEVVAVSGYRPKIVDGTSI